MAYWRSGALVARLPYGGGVAADRTIIGMMRRLHFCHRLQYFRDDRDDGDDDDAPHVAKIFDTVIATVVSGGSS